MARALLADFPVLVLDEPAEHLDPAAADALTADLLALTEGRSTLLITHRLAGLEQVDEIIVLDAGRVVERGTHDELLAAGGRYAGLWWEERMSDASLPVQAAPATGEPPTDRRASAAIAPIEGATTVSLDLARWQFASTSIYHFLFVPVTIGLAFLVALLQTAWYRNGDETYRRLARFFGTLLLINVAIGVVTGLIQEFEFGMNWSAYSRLVGNVFGGPLAMEGLVAFFLESTFLGIWIFGWNRLSKRAHLACIWLVAAGTMLSAAFIMAANSWMQHPVGYTHQPAHDQPELNNIWALFTNPVFLWGYTHVAAGLAGHRGAGHAGGLGLAPPATTTGRRLPADRRRSLVVLLPAVVLALFVGSELGVIEGTYQPMKIAAAEALWNTCDSHCSFSLRSRSAAATTTRPRPRSSGPRPAVDPGHQPRRRQGAGHEPAATRSTRRSTARGTTSPTSSSSTGRCG